MKDDTELFKQFSGNPDRAGFCGSGVRKFESDRGTEARLQDAVTETWWASFRAEVRKMSDSGRSSKVMAFQLMTAVINYDLSSEPTMRPLEKNRVYDGASSPAAGWQKRARTNATYTKFKKFKVLPSSWGHFALLPSGPQPISEVLPERRQRLHSSQRCRNVIYEHHRARLRVRVIEYTPEKAIVQWLRERRFDLRVYSDDKRPGLRHRGEPGS